LTLEEEGRRREGEREMWKGKEEEAVRELSRVWDLRWFGTWRRRSQASSLHPSGLLKQPRNCLSSEATTFDVILETQTQFDERP
jgi:hypothetical protein